MPNSSTLSTEQHAPTAGLRTRTVRTRAVATVAGALAATVVHVMAHRTGVEMLVPAFDGDGTQQIATVGVTLSALAATLIGWAAAWAATRFTPRPRAVWLIAVLIGLAASFMPVIAIEATTATRIVLAIEHLAVAVVVIPVFTRTLPSRR